jgi:hypothetical protein
VCLPQTIATHVTLKHRGIKGVMNFGTAKGQDKPLNAHAWIEAAGVELTGYSVGKNFAEIACFM